MENNKNKKSVKFQGDMLNFCDFIQVFVCTTNHHLKKNSVYSVYDVYRISRLVAQSFLVLSHYRSWKRIEGGGGGVQC